jgi:putative phosphonoacetaldehyde dehydrogenase
MTGSRFHEESMRIDGRRVRGSAGLIEVRNPWSGEVVGTVPRAGVAEVRQAFDIAARYRPVLSRAQRAQILEQAARQVVERIDELATLITLESGLCMKDSRYEVGRVRDVFRFAAQAALVDDGQVFSCDITPHGRQRRVYTQRDPLLGVISAITPFNHPMNQVAHKVAPAIATNNRMVLKPSEKVPLSALRLADLLYEAGLPPAMFQVVTGDPALIADELLTNPNVDLVTFTGGVAIGKSIAAKVGYRRMVLELGGNDPLIVLDDADLDEAAALAASGSYRNSGQRCTAVKRILVQRTVADHFVERLLALTRAWRYGDPTDESIDMGTVIDETAARCFEARVEGAVAAGAVLLHGNRRVGASYSPTLVDHVDPAMTLVAEETFGPVSPVIRFDTLDEVIGIVNRSRYALSSAVCTNRWDAIARLVGALQVGTVNVREVPGYRLESTPFGGIKDSGLGYKEGIQEAVRSFTNVKTYSLPWPMGETRG